MAGWPEVCWVMSQVRDRTASTGLRDVHLTCSNYWKQHWEHGNMEVVEVALRFQITLSLLRNAAGRPSRTVMWILELVFLTCLGYIRQEFMTLKQRTISFFQFSFLCIKSKPFITLWLPLAVNTTVWIVALKTKQTKTINADWNCSKKEEETTESVNKK